ncbi:hypothetical protein E2C01_057602 [Portunus trituberculatus]|uniref:Uncharacterized protein n=1 Tax=Portunus trituberculatus TaxID=210409 RepID=A0A5B7H3U1_PORTR|nr:hypothetical protein [Portunus trituberculatus]
MVYVQVCNWRLTCPEPPMTKWLLQTTRPIRRTVICYCALFASSSSFITTTTTTITTTTTTIITSGSRTDHFHVPPRELYHRYKMQSSPDKATFSPFLAS